MELNTEKKSKECEKVNLTQLILNFLSRYQKKIECDTFEDIIINIKKLMDNKEVTRQNLSTLGQNCTNNPGLIHDQSLSNELWYWISNDYIKKQYGSEDPSEIEKPFLKLTPKAKERIPDLLEQTINWNLSEETKSSLDETIDLIISQMNNE